MCGISIYCPKKRREIIIKHSILSHELAQEIYRYEVYSELNHLIDFKLLEKIIIEDEVKFAKILWTLTYFEKTFINKKNNCVEYVSSYITGQSDIKDDWEKWYRFLSEKYYNLTKKTYPQIGCIFITNKYTEKNLPP